MKCSTGWGVRVRTSGALHVAGTFRTSSRWASPSATAIRSACVITRRAILEAFQAQTGFFSTFGGNPVAAAAGLAVLEVLEREQLMANALATGAHLRAAPRRNWRSRTPAWARCAATACCWAWRSSRTSGAPGAPARQAHHQRAARSRRADRQRGPGRQRAEAPPAHVLRPGACRSRGRRPCGAVLARSGLRTPRLESAHADLSGRRQTLARFKGRSPADAGTSMNRCLVRRRAMKILLCALMLAGAVGAAAAADFHLTSTDFKANGELANKFVYQGFGCHGDNVSPALSWSGAPTGTKSYALLVHDPDAPTGGAGWWHWIVYNIPATAQAIAQGAGTADGAGLPEGRSAGQDRFRLHRLGWPVPAAGPRQAPLPVYFVRPEGRQARGARRRQRGADRLHGQRQFARPRRS